MVQPSIVSMPQAATLKRIATTQPLTRRTDHTIRPKTLFHQLRPSPLEVPEIIHKIRSYLSVKDLEKCTHVCHSWATQFLPFIWESIYYCRPLQGSDPALLRHGHLVRKLRALKVIDKDLRTIARNYPGLTALELEIENLQDSAALLELSSRAAGIQRLTLKLENPKSLESLQLGLLEPIAQAKFGQLTELRLRGVLSMREAPAYRSDMLLECLIGAPLLQLLELDAIPLVGVDEQFHDAPQTGFTNSPGNTISTHDAAGSWKRLSKLPWKKSFTIEPYKNQYLTTIKLTHLFTKSGKCNGFLHALLQRAPNLTHLALNGVQSNLDGLGTLCPNLRVVSLETAVCSSLNDNLSLQSGTSFAGNTLLENLRSLRLSGCLISDELLAGFHKDFTRYQLKHLEITRCRNLTVLGLARFLAQCWALETVWVDQLLGVMESRLLPYHTQEAHLTEIPYKSASGRKVSNAIRWECNRIRYLDVYGALGSKDNFENILLDLLPRLDSLEFLGMCTMHVDWLMESKPLRLRSSEQREVTISDVDEDGVEGWENWTTRDSTDKAEALRMPLDMCGSVTTLSLEASNRPSVNYSLEASNRPSVNYSTATNRAMLTVESAQYLYYAFPSLKKIVYCCAQFPFTIQARDWLLDTPRRITVTYRTKEDILASVLNV